MPQKNLLLVNQQVSRSLRIQPFQQPLQGALFPNKVDYAGANLVANHAYSILGIWETHKRQYVVLRNPWGYHEGSLNVATGTWSTQETWGTASLTLPGSGVFALEIHTFREYFMGFGGAG
jgi:hypothetical protein